MTLPTVAEVPAGSDHADDHGMATAWSPPRMFNGRLPAYLALLLAALAWLLVVALRRHRPDLDAPPALAIAAAVGAAAWLLLRAVSVWGRRSLVALFAAVQFLIVIGIMVRLRVPPATDVRLAGLTAALAVGFAGLVVGLLLLAGAQIERNPHGGRRRIVRRREARGTPPLWVAVVFIPVLLVVGLAVFDRVEEGEPLLPVLHDYGVSLDPTHLLPFVLLTLTAALWATDWEYPPFLDYIFVPLAGVLVFFASGWELGPAAAYTAGAAVMFWKATGRLFDGIVSSLIFAACVTLILALSKIDVFINPFDEEISRYAALSPARGGVDGVGPGLGLAEAMEYEASNRYALSVVGEELGLVGLLLLLLAVAVLVSVILNLGLRCTGPAGLWASGLAVSLATALTLPLLSVAVPWFDVGTGMPFVAADELATVAALWSLGIVIGASVASRPHDDDTPRPRRDRIHIIAGGVSVAVIAVLLANIAILRGPALLREHDPDAAAHTKAIDAREGFGTVVTSSGAVPAFDDDTLRVITDAILGDHKCPGPTAHGDGGLFGPRCEPSTVELTVDDRAQATATTAIAGVQADAALVVLDAKTGEVTALASTPVDDSEPPVWVEAAPLDWLGQVPVALALAPEEAAVGAAIQRVGDIERSEPVSEGQIMSRRGFCAQDPPLALKVDPECGDWHSNVMQQLMQYPPDSAPVPTLVSTLIPKTTDDAVGKIGAAPLTASSPDTAFHLHSHVQASPLYAAAALAQLAEPSGAVPCPRLRADTLPCTNPDAGPRASYVSRLADALFDPLSPVVLITATGERVARLVDERPEPDPRWAAALIRPGKDEAGNSAGNGTVVLAFTQPPAAPRIQSATPAEPAADLLDRYLEAFYGTNFG